MKTNKQAGTRKVNLNQKVQRVLPGVRSGVGATLLLSILLWPGGQCFAQQTAGAQALVISGFVYDAVVTNGGSGYSVPPTVTFIGGGGSGATATAFITNNGTVIDIRVDSAGTGYTSPPAVVIEPPLFDLNNTLVGYWPFENNVNDSSTYNQTGAVNGSLSYPAGVVGKAVSFNGASYVDFGDPVDGRYDIAPGQDCTIALWVKTAMTGNANWPNVVDKDTYCVGQYTHRGWSMFFNTTTGGGWITGGLEWGNLDTGMVGTGVVNDSQWHYLIAAKQGTNIAMYLDGSLVSTASAPESSWYPNSISMRLGGNMGCFTPYTGLVDEFRFYKRALQPREIKALNAKLPVITQPQSLLVYWGRTATFSTVATGNGPLSYQWRKDGQPIAWGTNAALTITNAQAGDAGSYQVVVSNPAGTVYSQLATLTVNPAGVALDLYPGLKIDGVIGQTYGVQSSTNLANPNAWVSLTSITLTSPVQMWFDTQAARNCDCSGGVSSPQRFYRVVPVP